MRHWDAFVLVSFLCACCGGGCAEKSSDLSGRADLVSRGFEALEGNNITLVQPLLMTERRISGITDGTVTRPEWWRWARGSERHRTQRAGAGGKG